MVNTQLIVGLIIGIIILILLILKTKIHPFLAMILTASFIGLFGGMESKDVVKAITSGFGGTLSSIGIIIGFGVMMGQLFEVSGAAERMAKTFIKILGKGKEEIALVLTGFIVSIPIFCDSGFVILSPLVKAISKTTKKSMTSLGLSLAIGLVVTHSLVPPTPGPVGVAGIYGVSIGFILLWGIVIAIPMVIAGLLYAKKIGKEIYLIATDDELEPVKRVKAEEVKITYETVLEENKDLPSNFITFMPILLPIILILINQLINFFKIEGVLKQLFVFIGNPVIAVAIGLIVAILGLTRRLTKEETIRQMEIGIKSAGIILLVTGAGGSLGSVLRSSGAGNEIAQFIASISLPPILLPFIIATLVRLIQGSGTVAMITAASITAPILANLDVNLVFAALASCVGSLFFSNFNDSYFWVVHRTLGITNTREQLKAYSMTSTIAWFTGGVTVFILNAIFG